MVNVSQAYIDTVDTDLIEDFIHPEMKLFKANMDVQTRFRTNYTESGQATFVSPDDLLAIDGYHKDKVATCELNYTKAGGGNKYSIYWQDEGGYYNIASRNAGYVTREVSAASDTDGLYSITDDGLVLDWVDDTYYYWETPPKVTVLCSETARKIDVGYVQGGSTVWKSFESDNGSFSVDVLPAGIVDRLIVKVTKLSKPQQHGRIFRVIFGEMELYERNDIVEISHTDENDIICAELPQNTLSITVKNYLNLSEESEADEPSYIRFHTQAMVTLFQDTITGDPEEIPLGRWFLDKYEVKTTDIIFHFTSGLGVLNEETQWWTMKEHPGLPPLTLGDRILESLGDPYIPYSTGIDREFLPKTYATRYNITSDIDTSLASEYSETNIPPYTTTAQVLQMLCNGSNNMLLRARQGRDYYGVRSVIVKEIDLTSDPSRVIYERFCYEKDFSAESKISNISATYNTISGDTGEKELSEFYVNRYPQLIEVGELIDSIYDAVDDSPPYIKTYLFAYAGLVWDDNSDMWRTLEAVTRSTVSNDEKRNYNAESDGNDIALSNPTVTKGNLNQYTSDIYNFLKHNKIYTLSVRRYPEIDTGDLVWFESKDKNRYKCIVMANNWNISGGRMRGTIVLRRVDDDI